MSVFATCTDCGDEHPVGDRQGVPGTTACPVCGSTSYGSTCDSTLSKSDAERIKDAVEPVDGVGAETVQNIVGAFSLYAELERASVDELVEIENVGKTTAERIKQRV